MSWTITRCGTAPQPIESNHEQWVMEMATAASLPTEHDRLVAYKLLLREACRRNVDQLQDEESQQERVCQWRRIGDRMIQELGPHCINAPTVTRKLSSMAIFDRHEAAPPEFCDHFTERLQRMQSCSEVITTLARTGRKFTDPNERLSITREQTQSLVALMQATY